eukprot:358613-Chlamydomonas_euryale.AAC.1
MANEWNATLRQWMTMRFSHSNLARSRADLAVLAPRCTRHVRTSCCESHATCIAVKHGGKAGTLTPVCMQGRPRRASCRDCALCIMSNKVLKPRTRTCVQRGPAVQGADTDAHRVARVLEGTSEECRMQHGIASHHIVLEPSTSHGCSRRTVYRPATSVADTNSIGVKV